LKRISVVIPAHNAGRFLPEALDSIFSQELEDFEVVVVDDGSTDDTADVARRYGRGVTLLRQRRAGSASARNLGIRSTEGELVAFLDADDLWVREKSRLQLRLLEEDGSLGLVFSDMVSFGPQREDGRSYFQERGFGGRCVPSSVFLTDMISTPTVIMRRRCLEAVGLFDESLPIGQDTDLWFRVALSSPFGVVSRPLVRRRFHQGNVTRDSRLLARCVVEVWGRYLQRCIEREPEMEGRLRRDFARKRWDDFFQDGCGLLRERRWSEGRRALRQAIGIRPLRPRPYAFYMASLLGIAGGSAGGRP